MEGGQCTEMAGAGVGGVEIVEGGGGDDDARLRVMGEDGKYKGRLAGEGWDDDDDASIATCNGNCSEVYGNLYNWYVVDTGNLAPHG